MIERGYFERAVRIVWRDPWTYVGGGLVLHGMTLLSFGLLAGPSICGLVWVTLKHLRGQEVTFADLFRGFEDLPTSTLAGLAFFLMVAGGLPLLVVPGIVLGALTCFTFPFIVDRGMRLGQAMEASQAMGGRGVDLLDRSLFFLVALLVGVSGMTLALVGLAFTWPVMWAAVAVAYHDLTEPERSP